MKVVRVSFSRLLLLALAFASLSAHNFYVAGDPANVADYYWVLYL